MARADRDRWLALALLLAVIGLVYLLLVHPLFTVPLREADARIAEVVSDSHDLLLDVAGGSGINQSVAATKASGRIAQIGFLTGQTVALNLMPLIFRQTTLRGIAVAPRSSFERMNEFLNQHDIRPVIDQVYPFEQAREAYEHLAKGAFGKVVIKVG